MKFIKEKFQYNEETMGDLRTKDRLEVDVFTRNTQYFPNQNIIKNYREVLVDSIMKNGLREDNKFLNWAVDNQIPITSKIAEMMRKYLQEGKLVLDNRYNIDFNGEGRDWPVNSKAFTSEYKTQALLFLSDEDQAEDFGDLDTRPFKKVLEARNDQEIADIVDSWQTREGTGEDVSYGSRRTTKRIQKDNYKDVKEAIEEVNKILQTLKINITNPEGIIRQNFKNSIPKTTLLGSVLLNAYEKESPAN